VSLNLSSPNDGLGYLDPTVKDSDQMNKEQGKGYDRHLSGYLGGNDPPREVFSCPEPHLTLILNLVFCLWELLL
jgi:hypothetical protein